MKKIFVCIAVAASMLLGMAAAQAKEDFDIEAFTPNQFYVFVKVFGEMRGPLRSEIMKDRKTDFENADPLKYVEKIRKDKGVKKSLKANSITWEDFRELMGNILLSYFSIQPEKTKAAVLRQLASYDLFLEMDQIPEEMRPLIQDVLKTEAGSTLASAALDMIIQIPEGNIEIVKKNQKDLDRMFYTKYWKDELK